MATNDDDEDQLAREQQDQTNHLIISIPSPAEDEANVIRLPDADVGTTETDDIVATGERHVTFLSNELPSPSRYCDVLERQRAIDLVKDLPEISISEVTKVESIPIVSEQTSCPEERRIHLMLDLLSHFKRNLKRIEENVLIREANQDAEVSEESKNQNHFLNTLPVEAPQHRDLGTQTTSSIANASTGARSARRSVLLNVTTLKTLQKTHTHRSFVARTAAITNQQPDNRPPCERTHHTITISSNSTPRVAQQRPRSFVGRIGQTLCDFAAAACLCLQVNKDCVFCLGFFLAFVVSASFLTAFFYRTLTLSATAVRVPVDSLTRAPSDGVTIRFNGGYYYLYNDQKAQ